MESRGVSASGDGASSAARLRRSPHRKMPCGTAIMPNVLSFCSPSLHCSTRRARPKDATWHGRIATSPMAPTFDMLPRLEAQIERFAPGFRDCVLERRVFAPAALEAMDANLIGGDIGGGAVDLRQFLFRPTRAALCNLGPRSFIYARRPRHRAAVCTACAATMQPGWRFPVCE